MKDPTEYTITPLGAAIVEAMPDRNKIRKIKRRFKRFNEIPVSSIFKTQEEIEAFYREALKRENL